jgi:hypothetical protein
VDDFYKIDSTFNLFSSDQSFAHEFVNDGFPDTQSSEEKFCSILHQTALHTISLGNER